MEQLFVSERQSEILKVLEKKQKIFVPELVERFGVSPATVRNDLNEMESKGLLKRTHGGAIKKSKTGFEQTSVQKEVANINEKKAIAKAAAELVDDGDTISLDTGTTAFEFAREISKKRGLTVVTNDLKIAAFLEEYSDATVILAGGTVRRGFRCTVGELAVRSLSGLSVDKCFLATNGLTLEKGLTTPDIGQGEVKKALAKTGTQIIVLCDSKKLGRNALSSIIYLSEIDILVIDNGADPLALEEIADCEVEIIKAK